MTKDNGNKSYEELARDNQVTLSDGKVVTIDLYQATWDELADEIWKGGKKRYNEIISKLTDLTVEDIQALTYPDGKLIQLKLHKALKNLNDFDPN